MNNTLRFTTALPLADNDGNSVKAALSKVILKFHAMGGMNLQLGRGCWINDEGVVVEDEVVYVTVDLRTEADVPALKQMLLDFKAEAKQQAVILAGPGCNQAIRGLGTPDVIEGLCQQYGGATVLDTHVVSFINPEFL